MMPSMAQHFRSTDLRAASRLAVQATLGLTDLVENLHHNIQRVSPPLGAVSTAPTSGITGLVYRSIRGVTRLVGGSLEVLLGQVDALLGPAAAPASPEREAVLAALNGVLGDHLAATHSPLAITMNLRGPAAPRSRVLLMVHGLCMHPQQWQRHGHDHGTTLAAEGGYTPLYLHYNSGLSISTNGALLANLLRDELRDVQHPPQELAILAHSMGGLVARSAVHQAQQRGDDWPRRLKKLVFLGTPHHGAALERAGHALEVVLGASPYTAAFLRLSQLRSAGITDLRHGRVLDGMLADQSAPLPAGVACYAAAGELGPGLIGDGLVSVNSALGRHRQASRRLNFEPGHQWVGPGIGHLDLLSHAQVLAQLRQWLL